MTNSKRAASKIRSSAATVSQAVKSDGTTRNRLVEIGGDNLVASKSSEVFVTINQVFIDTQAGSVKYEQVIGANPNVDLLIRQFKQDPAIQDRISTFYRSLKINNVLQSLVQTPQCRPSDVQFSATSLTSALVAAGATKNDALVMTDQLVPALRKAGFVISTPERYFMRFEDKKVLVTVEDLKRDVAAQHCAQIIDKTKINAVGTNRYSKGVLGEMVSLDIRAAGARMLSQAAYGKVVDDVCVAIRANIDVENEVYRLAVPEWLRDHPVIAELSTNLTFVTAAFAPSMNTKNVSLSVDSDDMRKYLDILSASLKASSRYRCVTLKYLLEEFSLRHAFDYNDELAFASLTHSVGYETGIMSAIPTTDGNEVIYLDRADSRVAELLMMHDQGLFSIESVSAAVHRVGENEVADSALWDPSRDKLHVRIIDTEEEFIQPEVLVALSTAQRVSLRCTVDEAGNKSYLINDREDKKGNDLPDFVYHVHADGKRLPLSLRNRMLDKDYIITADPVTAVLLAKPFEAKRPKNPSRQLPEHDIYFARLMGVPKSIIQTLNRGVKYSLEVGNAKMQGEFYLKSLDSMRQMSSQCVLVNPVNAVVTETIMRSLDEAFIDGGDGSARSMYAYNAPLYNYILDMADRLSPSFREDVHQKLIDQSLPSVAPEQSAAMRSAYNRANFAAQVDLFALHVYLEAIGCSEAAAIVGKWCTDEGMQMAMSLRGSKRRPS